MNDISRHLLDLARRNAAVHARHPSLQSIMVTGSVARGEADGWSDIDTILYYDTPPSEEALLRACEEIRGTRRVQIFRDPNIGTAEQYHVEGVACQFAHLSVSAMEDDLAAVTERLETDVDKQTALAGLLDGIPIHGAETIEQWKARAAYPEALAEKVVRERLAFYPLWVTREMFAGRGDLLFFYRALTEAETNLAGIVLALNCRYVPKEIKRMDSLFGAIRVAPADMAPRLRHILRAEPHEAVDLLGSMIDETLSLIDLKMPSVDTELVRKRVLAQAPPPHTPQKNM